MNEHYDKWQLFSPIGLLIVGFGMSLIGDATLRKMNGKRGWVLRGTVGLIVFNAGLAIFGEAIKSRTLYENQLARLMLNGRDDVA